MASGVAVPRPDKIGPLADPNALLRPDQRGRSLRIRQEPVRLHQGHAHQLGVTQRVRSAGWAELEMPAADAMTRGQIAASNRRSDGANEQDEARTEDRASR